MNILAIDDEELTQNFIEQVLQKEHTVNLATSGEEGIKLAGQLNPDLIILDVNMPGMNGYATCEKLKQAPGTKEIPVLFLSANTDLDEQMRGYAVGGDDYLVKPCEPKTLQAKVNVMLRLHEQQATLKEQFNEAQKTAFIAMVGNSEIGLALQFVENSFLLNDYQELADAFFTLTNKLQLVCAVMFFTQDGPKTFFSDGIFSPLEEELLEKMRGQDRIFDFQARTFINYPNATLLIKNMPVNDKERYGRIKDLLPSVLGSLSNKILTMKTSTLLKTQSTDLQVSYDGIKTSLLHLTNTISDNLNKNNLAMRNLFIDMQDFLPRLALEEDQETFILDHLEKITNESSELNAASAEHAATLHSVVNTLQFIIDKQQDIVDDLSPDEEGVNKKSSRQKDEQSNIDFF